eukprot:scaffold28126_cov99-Amphora_coffeaeformis.AAC.1
MKLSSPPSPPLLAPRHALREEDGDNDVVACTKTPQLKSPQDDTLSVTSCTTQEDDFIEAAAALCSPPPPPRLSWMESTSMHSFGSMISSTSTLPPSSLQLLSSLQRQVHFQEDVHLIHDSVEDSEDENFYDSAKGLLTPPGVILRAVPGLMSYKKLTVSALGSHKNHPSKTAYWQRNRPRLFGNVTCNTTFGRSIWD